MGDENLNISVSSNTGVSTEASTITKLEKKEKVTIKRTANHNEISIMESMWLQITRKIGLISLKKRFDINAVLIGAAIPYAIDIINDYIHKAEPNYFPFFICVFLTMLSKFLAKYIPFLGGDKTAINQVHLDDLKNYITQVDNSSNASQIDN